MLQSKFTHWFTNFAKYALSDGPVKDLVPTFYGSGLSAAQLDAFTRPEARWRKMLLCQPPIRRLHTTEVLIIRDYFFLAHRTHLNHTSVELRMGHIHDISFSWLTVMRQIWGVQGNVAFALDWHGLSAPTIQADAEDLRSLPQVDGQKKVVGHVDLVFCHLDHQRNGSICPLQKQKEFDLFMKAQAKYRNKGFEWELGPFDNEEHTTRFREGGYLQTNINLSSAVEDGQFLLVGP